MNFLKLTFVCKKMRKDFCLLYLYNKNLNICLLPLTKSFACVKILVEPLGKG